MSEEPEFFFNDITDKLNTNISSVCESLTRYKLDIKEQLESFNDNINTKIGQLYDIIESKQKEIEGLQEELSKHKFEETNFNKVSIIKTQDKEISSLKSELTISKRKITLLEKKLKQQSQPSPQLQSQPSQQPSKQEIQELLDEKPVEINLPIQEEEKIIEKVEKPTKKDKVKKAKAPKKKAKSKQEEPKQEEPKQEEPKQEEPKQEEPKQEEPKQEEPKQEEPKSKKQRKKRKTKKEVKEVENKETLIEVSEEKKKEIEKVVETELKDHANFVADEEEPIHSVSLEDIDIVEHNNKDYYLSTKNYIYEIANEEGDIGTRLGKYVDKKIHFF
jgi:hypothetical protein